jgi:hypothetical protein
MPGQVPRNTAPYQQKQQLPASKLLTLKSQHQADQKCALDAVNLSADLLHGTYLLSQVKSYKGVSYDCCIA